jgi:SAM-dependent methyltransferase
MISQQTKDRWYPPDRQNHDMAFRSMVYGSVTGSSRVLDAGAGAGEQFHYDLRDRVAEMVGVDLDPRVETNPQLHRGILASLLEIPFEDGYFDVVFSRYVLEHIEEPQPFLREMHRVLKPGGQFLFLTPNKWHYIGLASRFSPHSVHVWYNRNRGRNDEDTFPTCYRLNSGPAVRKEFEVAGFREVEMTFREACPNYLTFCMPAFLAGIGYEKLVNSSRIFAPIRCNILGKFQKEG